ncbi:M-phase phosphoprotein 6 [Mactra antiquata]
MAGDESKSTLSNNVLQMKFMKRSALRIEKEKSAEERKQIIDDEHWVLDLPPVNKKEDKYILEPSYERCLDMVYGRMSFQQCNPEVEKLMKINNNRLGLEEAERKEAENSVDDEEMARRYKSLSDHIAKKFATKREKRKKIVQEEEASSIAASEKEKRKFMKPDVDG